MSLTNPTIHVPDARVSVPSWVRQHLSWMLVALAVVATAAVLAVTLVDSDSGTDTAPATQTFDADRGSISAIDQRTAVGAAPAAGAPTLTDRGSIAAIERRAGTAGSLRHESISAIDHRTATQGR